MLQVSYPLHFTVHVSTSDTHRDDLWLLYLNDAVFLSVYCLSAQAAFYFSDTLFSVSVTFLVQLT